MQQGIVVSDADVIPNLRVSITKTPPPTPPPATSSSTPNYMYEWVWVTLALIFVVLCIIVFNLISNRYRHGPTGMNKKKMRISRNIIKNNNKRYSPHIRTNINTNTSPPSSPELNLPPVASLWWDKEEGAYMIELVVGNGIVELVLDTGSSQLSVKGTGCQWTKCDGSSCKTKSCPCGISKDGKQRTDCNNYYYNESSGRSLKPGECGAGTTTILTYGSQEDTISHYLDVLSIPRVSLTCDMLTTYVPTGPETLIPENYQNAIPVGEVIVHRVSHIKGTSSSNLFGLARPCSESNKEQYVVLDKLFGAARTPHWSIVLRPEGGWWAMGSLPCFNSVQYMPLIEPPEFSQFVTNFYIIPVQSFMTGPTLKHLQKIPSNVHPKYVIIDTGTTYTYGSTRLGEAMENMGYDESTWYLQFVLGDHTDSVTLTYSPHDLSDRDFPNESVLQCKSGRTLDNYDDIFPPDSNVLLFGAYMMQHMYWEFDLAHNRIGIQHLTR